jgi:hypothetical protein
VRSTTAPCEQDHGWDVRRKRMRRIAPLLPRHKDCPCQHVICKIIERRKKAVIAQLQTRPSSTISPDHVWRLYEGKKVRLTVKLLREEKPEGKPSVLLEGIERHLSGLLT